MPQPLTELDQRWWFERYRRRVRLRPLADEAIGRAGDDAAARARSLVLMAWTCTWQGDTAAADRALSEARRLFVQCGEGEGLVSCAIVEAQQRVHAGAFAPALELLGAQAPAQGVDLEHGEADRVRMDAHRGLYQFDDALRAGYRYLESAATSADPARHALALALLGGLQADLHNLEDAERLQRRACALVNADDALQAWWLASINLMGTLDYLGRALEAVPLVQALQAREPELPPSRAYHRLISYAAVWLHAGDVAQAQALLDQSCAVAPRGASRRIEWVWVQAELHNLGARHAQARQVCEDFIAAMRDAEHAPPDAPDRVNLPYDRVRLFEAAAAACEALGDSTAALGHQRLAFETYRHLVGRSARARRLALEIENDLAAAQRAREWSESQRAAAEREGVRLAALNDELKAANLAKSRFLAAASHDLRQPVHALALQMTALHAHLETPVQREMAGRMDRCISALGSMFEALLDMSSMDAGVLRPERVDFALSPLLAQLVEEFGPQASARGLRLALYAAPRAALASTCSDPALLARALRNLLGNAIKFTPRGGVLLTLRARRDARGAALWRVEVRDSGIGIATAEQGRVFDEFYQVANPSRRRDEGLGLGLSIVRRILHLLGHALSLRSALGQGSRFAIDLMATPGQSPDRAEATPSGSLLQLHVLLIEDDPEIRAATQSLLVQWGCGVVAVDSVEALRNTTCEPVDAVLADFRLPGAMNGVQGVEQLRRRLGRDVPALIITGDTATSSLRELQASGLPWLIKPLAPQRLRDWLAALG